MTDHVSATVGEGYTNTASGVYATIPGGFDNTAQGDYSFAAGRRAKANDPGSFVWGDSTNQDFASTAANQFMVRASGGVTLAVGSGAWRIEPNATNPNLIGGYSGNWLTPGVYGATISGGGRSILPNSVTDSYSTVGGGMDNRAGDAAGTATDRSGATVGGFGNTASGFLRHGGWGP